MGMPGMISAIISHCSIARPIDMNQMLMEPLGNLWKVLLPGKVEAYAFTSECGRGDMGKGEQNPSF